MHLLKLVYNRDENEMLPDLTIDELVELVAERLAGEEQEEEVVDTRKFFRIIPMEKNDKPQGLYAEDMSVEDGTLIFRDENYNVCHVLAQGTWQTAFLADPITLMPPSGIAWIE